VPYTRTVTLGPGLTTTAWVSWTPTYTGSQCIQIELTDPDDEYEAQRSQRNVRVVDRPPCGQTRTYTFTVYNDSPFSATLEIGLATFDVPEGWEVTTVPSETVELGPFGSGVVTLTVRIPCPLTFQAMRTSQQMHALQQVAGGVPTIDVEGYIEGDLKGGIEIQFPGEAPAPPLYLPVILKNP
jgi:hypothetical protein